MGLIARIPQRWRAQAALQVLRVRYWYLDTDAGRHAQVWAFAASVLVLVIQIVRMVVAVMYPPARPEPAHAVIWWVVQLIIAIISAVISYALRTKIEPPKPAQMNSPVVEDGRAIPEAHGTVWIEDEFILAHKVVGRVPIKSGGKK